MLVEATLPRPERTGKRGHLTPAEAGLQARAAGAKRLLLVHISDELDAEWARRRPKRLSADLWRWRRRARCSRCEVEGRAPVCAASGHAPELLSAPQSQSRERAASRALDTRSAVAERWGMSTSALSSKARAALDAICDTFAPGGDGLPSATELGVPEALLSLVARNPRAAERKQVTQLLGLWDTPPAHARSAAAGSSASPRCPRSEREQVLLSWSDSRVPQRRAAFQALRKGALLAYYGMAGANGDRNPVWDAIGYPGPLGPPENPPPQTIEPLDDHRRH